MNEKINLYQHSNTFLLEAFDEMTVNILRIGQQRTIKFILLCGSDPGVGTTTVAINLAISFAQGQTKVLLVDGDMRKNTQHKRLGNALYFGLSNYLEGKKQIGDIIHSTSTENLDYVSCGTSVSHSNRLLASGAMRSFVNEVAPWYDYILFDSPSLEAVSDAVALSLVTDSVLIVTESNRTTRKNLQKTKEVLDNANSKIIGVVLNKVDEIDYRAHMEHFDYFAKERYLHKHDAEKGMGYE